MLKNIPDIGPISRRHYFLLAGLAAVIVSFLFFGRSQGIYSLLLLLGFLTALVAWLLVLFKKGSIRHKLSWTLVVVLALGLQRLSQPVFVRASYGIFIHQHQQELAEINAVLLSKNGEFTLTSSTDRWQQYGITPEERVIVQSFMEDMNMGVVSKDAHNIYYQTYGMLDVSNGVYYFYTDTIPDARFRPVFDKWYY